MRLRLRMAATVAALAGVPAVAQGITDWDTDADGVLRESEFTQGVFDSGVFEEWDTDDDEAVGYSELSSGLYSAWDANDDGELSVDEWDSAVDLWFGEFDVNLSVENWDADGNGIISEGEFAEALEETDLLARLGNEDEVLAEDELASGLFDIADTNDDETVAEEEESFFTDVAEFFAPEDEPTAEVDANTFEDNAPLIERGEAFMQLPIPCGNGENACEDVAARFCSTLGYGEPIDFLDVNSELYAIRCKDEI
ncbi:hypothetical protein SAMN04488020_1098 [Palleronia marisminoris]|uniref:hypothetical protein n=1 Tax=Palleronia marisminoris TaxID=315423 RepID=UPI0008F02DF4|nr:hypothetical protein [Palleronia marisminoris]SFH26567.1 hypothetical protein SAMN04488020_1098 [Palleronia marisminoris]